LKKLSLENMSKISLLIIMIMVSGCISLQELPEDQVLIREGIYHKVKPDETIWRIAKAYEVNLEDIIASNKIPNVARLEENQLVFIPGADRVLEIKQGEDQNENEFIWPVDGRILNYFGRQKDNNIVNGIHILSKDGEPVNASRMGHVVFADYLTGYAYTVIIDHSDGYHTVYAQNSQLLVKNGDLVTKGHPIAKLGRKGQMAYLHFEVRKNGKADNPMFYLP